jgi:hypothetical protein
MKNKKKMKEFVVMEIKILKMVDRQDKNKLEPYVIIYKELSASKIRKEIALSKESSIYV